VARFRIVPERSEAWVDADSSVHPIHGHAAGLEGSIEAEVADGRLDLSVQPKMRLELAIDRLTSGNPLYDSETRRRVEARRYPTIVGEAREVSELATPGSYRVRGDLTFHGVTRSVEGEVAVSFPDDRTLALEGQQTFDVREFGVEPPKLLMLRVHPEAAVRVRVVAERD
jgi:polyisoprenoid-binding protein YceI